MAIECPFLGPDDAYERTVTGWVDRGEGSLLELNARLADGRVDLAVGLLAEPSPSYQLFRATATARSDATRESCGHLLEAFRSVGSLRIVSGFRRLCFTYRKETAALFTERPVRTPAVTAMYASAPGQKLVFHRCKRTRLARAGHTFSLYQSMFDQVHGFELWYDVDGPSQVVVGARLLTPRLPYMGICDEPQRRVRDMVGVTLDARWPGVVRARLGGRQGCFQLMDLTSDLFRLLNPS